MYCPKCGRETESPLCLNGLCSVKIPASGLMLIH